MKAYLRNGKTIRIPKSYANRIISLKKETKDRNPHVNMVLRKDEISDDYVFMIDVNEVIAIK